MVHATEFRTKPHMNNELKRIVLKIQTNIQTPPLTVYFNLTTFIIKINQYFHYKVFSLKPQQLFSPIEQSVYVK